jgi:hypothetical protein
LLSTALRRVQLPYLYTITAGAYRSDPLGTAQAAQNPPPLEVTHRYADAHRAGLTQRSNDKAHIHYCRLLKRNWPEQ